MIYLVFAIIILHLITLPLVLSVKVDIDSDKDIGAVSIKLFFITIIAKHFNIATLFNRNADAKPETKSSTESGSSRVKRFFVDCAVKILKSVRIKKSDLVSKIGTGDAAADGMTVGIMRIMYSQVCAFFGYGGKDAQIEPEYNAQIILFDYFGIFSISFADIIFAVLRVVLSKIARVGQRRSYANVAE